MARFWNIAAGGLLLALSLTLLEQGVEGQWKVDVSGQATINLGQDREIWRPLVQTSLSISQITSIQSSFQIRTLDPEGVIFYGDTKNGTDWFILSLLDGVPLMQISRDGSLVSVSGGPRINDGKWHTLEVSNRGKFVLLNIDGSIGLEVGMQSSRPEVVDYSNLRLALGGILIDKEKMIIPFKPRMDGCVRHGSWLNLSAPWDAEVDELWPCYQNIQPGSYFPGTGFTVFNTSVFPMEEEHSGFTIEMWADFSELDGTILSIRSPGQQLMFALVASNSTKTLMLSFPGEKIIYRENIRKLAVTFRKDLLQILRDDDESTISVIAISPKIQPGYLSMWREGQLAFGCLLGEGELDVCSRFLTGCLKKIQLQGMEMDLDFAKAFTSVSSHSCPV
ncbi:sex hormone-binding globulin [Thalassophryne amazonica]|uniref:sex hormone-binding globulin n=1 Tax=Thalassophryne amazonica TaxID=390379 RepID=UPI0014714AB2|nr:sex hormone-binding globulin [Thalassophryne amazonica]